MNIYKQKKLFWLTLIFIVLFQTNAYAGNVNFLYPIAVEEYGYENYREIIKTYELDSNESPDCISRYPFQKQGYAYVLSDITKQSVNNQDIKDHIEEISVETKTNNIEQIIALLEPEKDYESEDGYRGVLYLDTTTIKTDIKGYSSSSYQVYETREYPNLSSTDTSLIPKSIQANGKNYSMVDIQWQTMNTQNVDYNQLPDRYKAVVKYSATASSSNVSGYITTASYTGQVSKVSEGKTMYTAYFIGYPMGTIETDFMLIEEITTDIDIDIEEDTNATLEILLTNEIENKEQLQENNSFMTLCIFLIVFNIVFLFLMIITILFFFLQIRKRNREKRFIGYS